MGPRKNSTPGVLIERIRYTGSYGMPPKCQTPMYVNRYIVRKKSKYVSGDSCPYQNSHTESMCVGSKRMPIGGAASFPSFPASFGCPSLVQHVETSFHTARSSKFVAWTAKFFWTENSSASVVPKKGDHMRPEKTNRGCPMGRHPWLLMCDNSFLWFLSVITKNTAANIISQRLKLGPFTIS